MPKDRLIGQKIDQINEELTVVETGAVPYHPNAVTRRRLPVSWLPWVGAALVAVPAFLSFPTGRAAADSAPSASQVQTQEGQVKPEDDKIKKKRQQIDFAGDLILQASNEPTLNNPARAQQLEAQASERIENLKDLLKEGRDVSQHLLSKDKANEVAVKYPNLKIEKIKEVTGRFIIQHQDFNDGTFKDHSKLITSDGTKEFKNEKRNTFYQPGGEYLVNNVAEIDG